MAIWSSVAFSSGGAIEIQRVSERWSSSWPRRSRSPLSSRPSRSRRPQSGSMRSGRRCSGGGFCSGSAALRAPVAVRNLACGCDPRDRDAWPDPRVDAHLLPCRPFPGRFLGVPGLAGHGPARPVVGAAGVGGADLVVSRRRGSACDPESTVGGAPLSAIAMCLALSACYLAIALVCLRGFERLARERATLALA